MKLTIKRLQRLLCALLCCVMLMGMAPGAVFAEEGDEETTEKTEQTGEPSVEDPDGTDPDGDKNDDPDTGEGDEGDGENGEPNGDDENGENTGDGTEPGENEGEGEENGDVPNSEGPGLEDEPVIQIPEEEEDGDGDDIMTIAETIPAGDTEFHKITSLDELELNANYIIVLPESTATGTDGSRIALTTTGTDYVAEITLTDGTMMVPSDANCVFSMTKLVSIDDSSANIKLESSGGNLKLNNGDGVFTTGSAADITTTLGADGTWTLASSSRALVWSSDKFDRANGNGTPVEIWTDTVVEKTAKYYQLTSLDQLADLENGTRFVVVAVNGGRRQAIGNASSTDWPDVSRGRDIDGYYITMDGNLVNSYVFGSFGPLTYNSGSGDANAFNYEFEYIQLVGGYRYYPQNLPGGPFRVVKSGQNNMARFESGTGDDEGSIYLRGNSSTSFLGDNGSGYTCVAQNGKRVPVEIYAMFPTNASTRVRFLDENGDVATNAFVDDSVTLIRWMPEREHDGYPYIFVGWSVKEEYAANAFLSLPNSSNLFAYDFDAKYNRFTRNAKDLGLLGDGDPEKPYSLSLSDPDVVNAISNGVLTLYPVYAVKGFDEAVTAQENGRDIVGVADWKADQGEGHRYQDPAREKWLGLINVEVYKDGDSKPWLQAPMYFSYHNDNTADLCIKFVWDDLVAKCDGDTAKKKLYYYVADINDKNIEQYPEHDQVGHFIIDGVIADQGGSEDGLYCNLNWMTPYGGQLDNVEGGSTVKIYVSTIYDVKYYLDDQLIGDWTDHGPYTTPGTENAFKTAQTYTEHEKIYDAVKNPQLMEHGTAEDLFDDGDYIARGVFQTFTYWMADPVHHFTTKQSPAELVPAGKTLTSTAWTLKNGDLTQTVAWSTRYDITGTKYTTGNTGYAYRDPDAIAKPAAAAPYTFHLYAYTNAGTAPPTGDGNNLLLWTALLTVSLGGLTCLGLLGRKKRQK